MAQRQYSSLRAVTQRISITPTKQLPSAVPHLVNLLLGCRHILAYSDGNRLKESPDAINLHKFRTQLTTLLNDKTPEGRWAAVILVKTTIDVGGYECLQRCGPWVRSLLTNLNKLDPATSRKFCIVALTKIFILTYGYPALVREITTPSLPAYITTCLNIIAPKGGTKQRVDSDLFLTILESMRCLLPSHPSVFRSFSSQLKELLTKIIALTSNGTSELLASIPRPAGLVDSAQALYVLLHHCAPKQTSSEEWSKTIETVIVETHSTLNKVYRCVVEERDTTTGVDNAPAAPTVRDAIVGQRVEDSKLGLPRWSGIHAGAERLRGLLTLLLHFTQTQTASCVAFPIGKLNHVLRRTLSLCGPLKTDARAARAYGYNVRFDDAVGREERDGLFAELPIIHAAALRTYEALFTNFGTACMSLLQSTLDLVAWVFSCEQFNVSVRVVTFDLVATLLKIGGSGLQRPRVRHLESLIRSCCEELWLQSDSSQDSATSKTNGKPMSTESILKTSKYSPKKLQQQPSQKSDPEIAASKLLTTFLSRINSSYISPRLRAELDRTAILTNDADAMTASVLNSGSERERTSKGRPSIMPFLARAHPERIETEALIRPRMAVLQAGNTAEQAVQDEEDLQDGNYHHNAMEVYNTAHVDPFSAFPDNLFETQQEIDDRMSTEAQYSASQHLAEGANVTEQPQDDIIELDNSKRRRDFEEEGAMSPAKRLHVDAGDSKPSLTSRMSSTQDSNVSTSSAARSQVGSPVMTAVPTLVAGDTFTTETETVVTAPIEDEVRLPASNDAKTTTADAGEDEEDFEMPPLSIGFDDEEEDEDAEGQ